MEYALCHYMDSVLLHRQITAPTPIKQPQGKYQLYLNFYLFINFIMHAVLTTEERYDFEIEN